MLVSFISLLLLLINFFAGNVIVDEFSRIHKEKEESVEERVSLRTLVEVLSPLSSFTQQHDLTQLSGQNSLGFEVL